MILLYLIIFIIKYNKKMEKVPKGSIGPKSIELYLVLFL